MKKIISIIAILVIGSTMLMGCAKEEVKNEAKSDINVNASESKDETTTTQTDEGTTTQTDETKKEPADLTGQKLVIYSAGPKSLSAAIEEAFEAETGVEVELLQTTTGKILSKLEAEKDNPVADVVVLASWPSALALKAQGMTQAYEGAKNADLLFDGFVDTDHHLFGYSASALGITYNTTLVDEAGKDWADYMDAKWADQVNMPDPTLSGSCMDFISGYISTFDEDGWSLFEGLKANGVTVEGANKAALEPVITGSKAVVLSGVDYMAYSAKAKGEPVDLVYPSSGTVVNPRAVMIMKDTKNVDAARAYVDFMLSDAAMDLVKDAYILPGRSDVKCDNRANMEDIPLLDYDWDAMAEVQAENIERFSNIFQ